MITSIICLSYSNCGEQSSTINDYKVSVDGKVIPLSRDLDYQRFRQVIITAVNTADTQLSPDGMTIWYQKTTVHGRDVILDDESDYSVFLSRLTSGQIRMEEDAVVLSLLSATQWQREPGSEDDNTVSFPSGLILRMLYLTLSGSR